ncbi:hypothetical protein COA01_15805 [Bacillus cereus]|uniref:hypothetical protein n=1 Tax=Bacillus cereus TaxID=1396 RepID=UPI000BFBC0D0|nr:hypothetical protein [Bacillus cereus]PGP21002.1 hypothetical protein COA01_15805 [Bacillus cereus]
MASSIVWNYLRNTAHVRYTIYKGDVAIDTCHARDKQRNSLVNLIEFAIELKNKRGNYVD